MAAGRELPDPASALGEGMDTALVRFLLELRSRGMIDKRLFDAFETTPRAPFLPAIRPGLLYEGIALPLPCGEEASDPFTLARHLVLLDVQPGARVLEIGTGSGFLAALMARLGGVVVSFERYRTLAAQARRVVAMLGCEGVTIHHGDGLARREEGGAFDRMILNGSLEMVPGPLLERLASGGLALGHRLRGGEIRLTLWRKEANGLPQERDLGPSRIGMLRAGLPGIL